MDRDNIFESIKQKQQPDASLDREIMERTAKLKAGRKEMLSCKNETANENAIHALSSVGQLKPRRLGALAACAAVTVIAVMSAAAVMHMDKPDTDTEGKTPVIDIDSGTEGTAGQDSAEAPGDTAPVIESVRVTIPQTRACMEESEYQFDITDETACGEIYEIIKVIELVKGEYPAAERPEVGGWEGFQLTVTFDGGDTARYAFDTSGMTESLTIVYNEDMENVEKYDLPLGYIRMAADAVNKHSSVKVDLSSIGDADSILPEQEDLQPAREIYEKAKHCTGNFTTVRGK